jgi:ketosteroid isomerase-like protein
MSDENVELVRRAVEAIGGEDPDAFIALCDVEFETQLVSVVGEPVHYRGPDGVRQFVADMSESWSSFAFEIESLRGLGDRVLVTGEMVGRGRVSGIEVSSRRALLVEVRSGALRSLRYFLEVGDAVRAAGLEE